MDTHQVWVFILPIPWVDGSTFNCSCWLQVQGRASFRPLCEIVLFWGCRPIPVCFFKTLKLHLEISILEMIFQKIDIRAKGYASMMSHQSLICTFPTQIVGMFM